MLAPQALLISMAYVINVLGLYWMVAYALVCVAVIVLHHRNGDSPALILLGSVLAIVALVRESWSRKTCSRRTRCTRR